MKLYENNEYLLLFDKALSKINYISKHVLYPSFCINKMPKLKTFLRFSELYYIWTKSINITPRDSKGTNIIGMYFNVYKKNSNL